MKTQKRKAPSAITYRGVRYRWEDLGEGAFVLRGPILNVFTADADKAFVAGAAERRTQEINAKAASSTFSSKSERRVYDVAIRAAKNGTGPSAFFTLIVRRPERGGLKSTFVGPYVIVEEDEDPVAAAKRAWNRLMERAGVSYLEGLGASVSESEVPSKWFAALSRSDAKALATTATEYAGSKVDYRFVKFTSGRVDATNGAMILSLVDSSIRLPKDEKVFVRTDALALAARKSKLVRVARDRVDGFAYAVPERPPTWPDIPEFIKRLPPFVSAFEVDEALLFNVLKGAQKATKSTSVVIESKSPHEIRVTTRADCGAEETGTFDLPAEVDVRFKRVGLNLGFLRKALEFLAPASGAVRFRFPAPSAGKDYVDGAVKIIPAEEKTGKIAYLMPINLRPKSV